MLYGNILTTEILKNKYNFTRPNRKKTRSTTKHNLIPNKHNTKATENLYVIKGTKLFNKLPHNIKVVENNSRFKIVINRIKLQLFRRKSCIRIISR